MLAFYRDGRQGEALGAFQRAREILADELGIDPSPELTRLHERMLKQDAGLDLRGEPLRGYRLLEKLGQGTTGIVFRAIQPHVGRDVAIKLFTNDSPSTRRSFGVSIRTLKPSRASSTLTSSRSTTTGGNRTGPTSSPASCAEAAFEAWRNEADHSSTTVASHSSSRSRRARVRAPPGRRARRCAVSGEHPVRPRRQRVSRWLLGRGEPDGPTRRRAGSAGRRTSHPSSPRWTA